MAWAIFAVSVAMGAARIWMGTTRGGSVRGVLPFLWTDIQYPLNAAATGLVGALVAWRHPNNRIWLALSGFTLFSAGFDFGNEYAIFAQLRDPGALPGGQVAVWFTTWLFQSIPTFLVLIFFLFPTGKPPSRRWGKAMWLIPPYVVLGWIPPAFLPGWSKNAGEGGSGPIHNPLAVQGAEPLLRAVANVSSVVITLAFLLSIASLVDRYRHAGSEERQQLKFFIFAAAFIPIGFALYPLYSGAEASSPLGLLAFVVGMTGVLGLPAAMGLAIFKYRLYDVDIVINRTLVYGALAAFITAIYVGIVVGVGHLIGSGGQPNLPLSIIATAVVAVAFQPVRERLQKIANRLVYGKRATPYEVLSQFSEHVAESYAADEVLPRMARVLADGTGAERAAVWLRADGWLRQAASWPVETEATDQVRVVGTAVPEIPGADRSALVRHQEEILGVLAVTKRKGEALTPVEEKLLADLASQAGLVLKNVGLTTELLARLDDLRASRKRLVAAQDEERRRLERNLHDGAQQNLVALKVKLGLAEAFVDKDPARVAVLLSEVKSDADEALETLRDLARGIYPPLLADHGLVAALEAQARKATVSVEVVASDVSRYPQELEAAVYFCCLEALQNIQKYAAADRVVLTLTAADGHLDFTVADDGHGFESESVKRGAGLTNMADRIEALGGTLEVASAPGDGTRVAGSVPVSSDRS